MKSVQIRQKGSSFLFVILLVVLLGVLGVGYMTITFYHAKSSAVQREYQQGHVMAQSIEESLVSSVLQGNNPAVQVLVAQAQMDYQKYEEYLNRYERASASEQASMQSPEDYKQSVVKSTYLTKGKTDLADSASAYTMLSYYFEEKYLLITTKVVQQSQEYAVSARLNYRAGETSPPTGEATNPKYVLGITTDETDLALQVQLWNDKTTPGKLLSNAAIESKIFSKEYVGDLVTQDDLSFRTSVELTGSIFAAGETELRDVSMTGGLFCKDKISLSGINTAIDGTVYAALGITAGGQALDVGGSLYSDDEIEVLSFESSIRGDIRSKRNVSFYSGTHQVNGTIYSDHDVMLNGVTCRNIVAKGNVILDKGTKVLGSIQAGGTVTVRNASVSGTVAQNVSGLPNVSFQVDLSPLEERPLTLQLDYESVAVKQGEYTKKEIERNGLVLDATQSDIYVLLNPGNNSYFDLDGNKIQVLGDHRVFLVVPDAHRITLRGTIGNESTASRLFLVSNLVGSKTPKITLAANAKVYGQIYMPTATLLTNYIGQISEIYGMATVAQVEGADYDRLNIYYREGDYTGTRLESAFGQAGTEQPIQQRWELDRYYEESK